MPHWDPFWPLNDDEMDEEAIVFSSVPVDENPRKTPPRRERTKGLTLDDIDYSKVDWPGWQNRPWDLSILQVQNQRMPPTPPEEKAYKDIENKTLSHFISSTNGPQNHHTCGTQTLPSPRSQPQQTHPQPQPITPPSAHPHPHRPRLHSRTGHFPTDSCCLESAFMVDIPMPCKHLRMDTTACHGCGSIHCGSCPDCLMEWYEEQINHRRRGRRSSLLKECEYGADS